MIMFIVGFVACWIILAIISITSDARDGGITLFEDWDSLILTLPAYIIAKPIIKLIEYKRKHRQK